MDPEALTPARLLELLSDAVAALETLAREHEARAVGGGGGMADLGVVHAASGAACARLDRACCVSGDPTAAAAGPGRVPLPCFSAEVAAALDALARLVSAGCAPGGASSVAGAALQALHAIMFAAPQRTAVIVRHTALMDAMVAALGVCGAPGFPEVALITALPVLSFAAGGSAPASAAWRDRDTGANLRTLAAAFAGAIAVPGIFDGGSAAEMSSGHTALAAMVQACPDDDRLRLCETMLAQTGFAQALSASIARDAASVPPGPTVFHMLPDGAALVVVAALCGGAGGLEMDMVDESLMHVAVKPRLEQRRPPPGAHPVADALLAAAPALLDAVVSAVVAGAPWYRAVAAALGRPAGFASRGDADRTAVLRNFVPLSLCIWAFAVSVMEQLPLDALTAGAAGRARAARLAPALLALAEAARAFACALPSPGLEDMIDDESREDNAALAAAAARLFDDISCALGGDAAAVLVGGSPSGAATLEALMRLSVSEPPLLGAGGGLASLHAMRGVFPFLCRARLRATQALAFLSANGALQRVGALLATSPALLAAAGATIGATAAERCFLAETGIAATVAERRAVAAGLLADLAAKAANDAGPSAFSLRVLANCRPFLAGCDDALRQARALGGGRSDGGGGGGGDSAAVWMRRAGDTAQQALLVIARSRSLEALRTAAAGRSFKEVARVLAAAGEEQAQEQAATAVASTSAPAAAAVVAAAAVPASAAPEAPVGSKAAARACSACGAAGAPLTCGGCRDARYCGAECQRRDWRAHKATCKQQRRQQMAKAAAAAARAGAGDSGSGGGRS